MSEYRLEMEHVSKYFPGVKALSEAELKVRPGSAMALLGENGAGKSTLMKCLFGIYEMDEGTIRLDGREVSFSSSREALEAGISMIHQELSPIPHMQVMESIWLNRFPKKGLIIDRKTMLRKTQELFDSLDIDIPPETHAAELSVSQLQLIEIAKAVSYDSRIIIMDEPTSSLTDHEINNLFGIIKKLLAKDVSIVYISHKLEEIFEIADSVTIMRDGCFQGRWPIDEITIEEIVQRMVGRKLDNRFPQKNYVPREETAMQIEHFTSALPHSFKDVSFSLRRGEILGIGGLVGAQRTELMESIFGMRPIESGVIYKNGEQISIKQPADAIKKGIGLLTEERRSNGIIGVLSVFENIVLANQPNYKRGFLGILNGKKRRRDAEQLSSELRIKTPSLDALAKTLSGGNQQKLLLARWLLTEPDILILDEPTRGIDVGSKYEIYNIMQDLVREGKSIIMVSSEMPELLGVSDRVMVMCGGRVAGICQNDAKLTDVAVMELATGFLD